MNNKYVIHTNSSLIYNNTKQFVKFNTSFWCLFIMHLKLEEIDSILHDAFTIPQEIPTFFVIT